jgi:hypothetical protein
MGRIWKLSLAVLLAGCFKPSLGDQPYACGPAPDPCPPDYMCNAANVCVRVGSAGADGGRPADARPLPDGPKNPDGFVCNGGAFLRCKDTNTAVFCNAGGNGEVEQHCNASCDAAHGICRQCTAATCSGDSLVGCDPNGQPLEPVTCPAGCDSSVTPALCWTLQPSNLAAGACDRGSLGDHDFAADVQIDTSACLASLGVPATQAGGPDLCIFRFRNVTLEGGVTVRFVGTRVPVILATDSMTVAGSLDVSAQGETGGPGTDRTGVLGGHGGSGTASGDNGGGGGGFGATGGAGGTGTASPTKPAGGAAFGAESLSPLVAGGYGGFGGYPCIDACILKQAGGGGGGAVQIVSCGALTIAPTAVINAGGGGGAGGTTPLINNPPGGGDGGGAGGAILIEAQAVNVPAGASLLANGGGGGGGAGITATSTAGAGQPGDDAVLGTTPASGGAAGGDSGGGGGAGGALDGNARDGSDGSGAGGGGGAVGRIRINVRSDKQATISGTVSPKASTGTITRVH